MPVGRVLRALYAALARDRAKGTGPGLAMSRMVHDHAPG
jgi:hypothetical protein